MDSTLQLGLKAIHHGVDQLDRIGQNLANALTPAYKREVAASRPLVTIGSNFQNVVDALQTEAVADALVVRTDVRPGSLKATGQSLDLALAGSGYFEISTPDGPAYTRQGDLKLDARGRLVTSRGYPVSGLGGEIFLRNGEVWVDQSGKIYESESSIARDGKSQGSGVHGGIDLTAEAIAQIKVVEPEEKSIMRPLGNGMFLIDGPVNSKPDLDVQVRQGYLENSNVSTMQEMVHLIETMRHVESMQKLVLTYDEMNGQAIRRLGEFS